MWHQEYSISCVSLSPVCLPPALYLACRMVCIPWISDHGTFCVIPLLLVYSLTHEMRPFVIWPCPAYPIFLHFPIHQKSYSLSLFFIYMENITHLITVSTCNAKSSLTLQVNFFQLWETHAKMVPNNSCPCLCVIPSSLRVEAEAGVSSI